MSTERITMLYKGDLIVIPWQLSSVHKVSFPEPESGNTGTKRTHFPTQINLGGPYFYLISVELDRNKSYIDKIYYLHVSSDEVLLDVGGLRPQRPQRSGRDGST